MEEEIKFNIAGTKSNPIKNVIRLGSSNWEKNLYKGGRKAPTIKWYNFWWRTLNNDELLVLNEVYKISLFKRQYMDGSQIICSPDTVDYKALLTYEIPIVSAMRKYGIKWSSRSQTELLVQYLKQQGYFQSMRVYEDKDIVVGISEKGLEELLWYKNKFCFYGLIIGVFIPLSSSFLSYLLPILLPFIKSQIVNFFSYYFNFITSLFLHFLYDFLL